MKRLLIVYHTQTGNTQSLAYAAYNEAKATIVRDSLEAEVVCKRAIEAGIYDLLNADALILATPENFGYMSGMIKDFLDRTYYPAEPHQLSLPYAVIVSAGNDGSGAVREIDRIMLGYPMRKVMEPLIVKGNVGGESIAKSREIGEAFITATAMGAF